MNKKLLRAPLIQRLLGHSQKLLSPADRAPFVTESLGYLLNARHGAVPSAEAYGLPDFSVLTHAPMQLLRIMERNIFQAVQSYEPRLQHLRVLGALDAEFPERMCFSISASLDWQEQTRVHYQSMLLPGGRVMVKAI